MKTQSLILLSGFLVLGSVGAPCQDNVTIPKSRLDELEKKEAELEKLRGKGKTNEAETVKAPLTVPQAEPTLIRPAKRENRPVVTLPPLKEGEPVDAAILAGYYRQDRAAADKRFRNQPIVVRGEIASFSKPIIGRNYKVLLEGDDRDTKVTCDMVPPERFKAVFPADDGQQLVGLAGETRIPMAKVGARVVVQGVCKGFRKSAVLIDGTDMRPAP